MIEPTKKEMKWFVKRLLELRKDTNGYHESVSFKLSDLKKWEEENKIKLSSGELGDRVFWMLSEIKNHYIEDNNNPLFAEGLKYNKPVDDKITIEGYTTKMLKEYETWLNSNNEAKLILDIKPIEKTQPIKFKTGGKNFEINMNDGNFKFGQAEGKFRTKTKEFKLLKCLVESKNSVVSYEIIFSCLGIIDNKPNRRKITDILKKVKYKMDILPEETSYNPNIFLNEPNSGYEIPED